jgi:hypothetical protein
VSVRVEERAHVLRELRRRTLDVLPRCHAATIAPGRGARAKETRRGSRWVVALALGLDEGEALGLKWTDVYWQGGVVRIRRADSRLDEDSVEQFRNAEGDREKNHHPPEEDSRAEGDDRHSGCRHGEGHCV